MKRSRLSALLSELPPVKATPDFAARTLLRLAAPERRPRALRRLIWAAAAVVVLAAAAVPAWLHLHRQGDREQARLELDALRDEHERLSLALSQIKRQNAQEPQLLYLGGTDSVDYVVDLRQLHARPQLQTSAPVHPGTIY